MKKTIQLHTASNFANSIIANALEGATLLGVHWPAEKEFAIVQRYSTWPKGWLPEIYVSFYDTEDELKAALKSTEEWSLCEDNYFARRVYRWDWGPVEMMEHSSHDYNIPSKAMPYDSIIVSDNTISDFNARMKAQVAQIQRAAEPHEFNATSYNLFTQDREVGSGRWPFTNIQKVPAPMLFITSTERERIQNLSKDVDMNAPIVLNGAPTELDSDGYWF